MSEKTITHAGGHRFEVGQWVEIGLGAGSPLNQRKRAPFELAERFVVTSVTETTFTIRPATLFERVVAAIRAPFVRAWRWLVWKYVDARIAIEDRVAEWREGRK